MGHRYRLFEVDKDGGFHDTGKVLNDVEVPEFDRLGYPVRRGNVVESIFKVYGFEKWIASYITAFHPEGFIVSYGGSWTWFIKK